MNKEWIGKKIVNDELGWCHILKFDSPKVLLYVEKGTKHFVVAKMYKAPVLYYKHDYYDIDSALEFYNRYVLEDNHD